MTSLQSYPSNPSKYIPFQSLIKAKVYRILNYGRPYDNYSHFRMSDNPELITDIYIDSEPYTMLSLDGSVPSVIDDSCIPYQIEILYTKESNKPMRTCIRSKADIDALLAKYGCKL
jgi:hypothetical protein